MSATSKAIASRLRGVLAMRRMSNRKFIAALEARDVSGSSEPAVYRYLRGETEPSISFIEAAAELLYVDEGWLAFGTEYRGCPRCTGLRTLTDADIQAIGAAIPFAKELSLTECAELILDASRRAIDEAEHEEWA